MSLLALLLWFHYHNKLFPQLTNKTALIKNAEPIAIFFIPLFGTPFHSEVINPQILAVIMAPAVKMTHPVVEPVAPRAEAANP